MPLLQSDVALHMPAKEALSALSVPDARLALESRPTLLPASLLGHSTPYMSSWPLCCREVAQLTIGGLHLQQLCGRSSGLQGLYQWEGTQPEQRATGGGQHKGSA